MALVSKSFPVKQLLVQATVYEQKRTNVPPQSPDTGYGNATTRFRVRLEQFIRTCARYGDYLIGRLIQALDDLGLRD